MFNPFAGVFPALHQHLNRKKMSHETFTEKCDHVYSKEMNQPRPRRCLKCNAPEIETSAPVEAPQNWFFTFGQGHVHPASGKRMNNSWVRIYGTHDEARAMMFSRYADKWAMQYTEAAFEPSFFPEGEFEYLNAHPSQLKQAQMKLESENALPASDDSTGPVTPPAE